ncbi:MAG: hypothetical protein CMG03_01140 [Candidatus Marinimicrobia bacterium]|nr:hypothetical protein [Candidatus Neomarinimicrobiota bacterium]
MKMSNTPINDLKSVLDTIQSGVISINNDKFLIFYNDKAKRIFSLSEEFIGKPISGIVRNPKILNFIEQSMKAIENQNEITTFEEDFFIDASQSFDAKGRQVLNLSEGLGMFSAGSAKHGSGQCMPCAFFHGERGCANGNSCTFCHMCPPGTMKRWKKERAKWKRMVDNQPSLNHSNNRHKH